MSLPGPVANNGLGFTPILALAEIVKIERLVTLLPDAPAIYNEWKRLVIQHGVVGSKVHDARLVAAVNVNGVQRILTFSTPTTLPDNRSRCRIQPRCYPSQPPTRMRGSSGPGLDHSGRATLDQDSAVIGYVFERKGFSRIDIDSNESDPVHSLAGQLTGFGVPAEYPWFREQAPGLADDRTIAGPRLALRTAHLRDPVGPQIQFASESFIDEVAAGVGADPVAFSAPLPEGTARHRRP